MFRVTYFRRQHLYCAARTDYEGEEGEATYQSFSKQPSQNGAADQMELHAMNTDGPYGDMWKDKPPSYSTQPPPSYTSGIVRNPSEIEYQIATRGYHGSPGPNSPPHGLDSNNIKVASVTTNRGPDVSVLHIYDSPKFLRRDGHICEMKS